MTEWRQVTLGELIRVKHGYAFKGEFFRPEGEEIVLTPGNFPIGGGLQFRPGKEKYYSGPYPQEYRLAPGDLILVLTDLKQEAPILGSPAFVPDEPTVLHNQRLGLVQVHEHEDVDRRFIYYLLLNDGTRAQLRATATGATVRHTAPGRIYEARVHLPPLPVQRLIGHSLGAMDDLIQNSRRRIELLEHMAQETYREWFVHLRYPGHQDAAIVGSPLGPRPQSWQVTRLGDSFEVVLGGTPSRRNPAFWVKGSVPWINSGRVNDLRVIDASELITPEAVMSCNTEVMPRGTTVIAITGATLGQVSMLEIDACANQSVVGIIDRADDLSEFLYLAVSDQIDSIVSHASGGAQQHINKSVVSLVEVLLPAPNVSRAFRSHVRPMFREIAALLQQNRRLVVLRDLLLPKLVTGQIDVSELDLDSLVESVA